MWEEFCVAYPTNELVEDTLKDRLRDNLRDDKIEMPIMNIVTRQYSKVMKFQLNLKHPMGMLVEICSNTNNTSSPKMCIPMMPHYQSLWEQFHLPPQLQQILCLFPSTPIATSLSQVHIVTNLLPKENCLLSKLKV